MSDSGWTKELAAEHKAQFDILSEQERVRAASGFAGALAGIAGLPMSPSADRATAGGASDPINPRKPRAHPERDLEKACSDLLQLDGWRMLKTDPGSDVSVIGAIRRAILGCPALNHVRELILSILKRCMRGKGFGEVGMADCLYVRYEQPPGTRRRGAAMVLWIEYKSETGKPSASQRAWMAAETARGALVLLAGADFPATVDGWLAWYRGSGLMRRPL